MAKAEAKTKPTVVSAEDFLNTVEDEAKRKDSFEILEMMKKASKEKPVMWGPAIVGFGKYHYKYESGHEGDSCLMGFSPRKGNLTLYVSIGNEKVAELLPKLGKHKTSKGSCLYINKLADVDKKILEKIFSESYNYAKKKHG